MTGDSPIKDDDDFLDDDFVIEDLTGKDDALEELFDAPTPKDIAAAEEAVANAAPDSDDSLFVDHTEGLQASESFEREGFQEDGESDWNGEVLDLESVGVPDASLDAEETSGDLGLEEARESFTAELDSLLQSDGEMDIDTEQELEVTGQDVDDGIHEFEQSGPFVLDDGEGLWSDDDEVAGPHDAPADEVADSLPESEPVGAEPTLAASTAEPEPAEEATRPKITTYEDTLLPQSEDDEQVEIDSQGLLTGTSASADEPEGEACWEPLPETSMDELSEVDELQRTDEPSYEDDEEQPEYGEVGLAERDLDDVDGHDIYADEESEQRGVVGGPGARRGTAFSIFLSVAASLLFVLGGAVIVMRPEWFGLRFEPARVERVEVPRPTVEVVVSEPPSLVTEPVPTGSGATGTGETGTGETGTGETGTGGHAAIEPVPALPVPNGTGDPGPIVSTQPIELPIPPVEGPDGTPPNGGESATTGEQPGARPVQAPPTAVVKAPSPSSSWPVPVTPRVPVSEQGKPKMARFGDGLMVGKLGGNKARTGVAVDGVLPGSRAFAELHNGNYFIGRVKHIATDSITLRVDTGEVTLANGDIARLTRLGSDDYADLQKATQGFVRLTNNNRLVGGILKRIADDYVVLDFNSNRVMLPKSAVGEIVTGDEDAVFFRTSAEEESWLRKLAESELDSAKSGREGRNKDFTATQQSGPPR